MGGNGHVATSSGPELASKASQALYEGKHGEDKRTAPLEAAEQTPCYCIYPLWRGPTPGRFGVIDGRSALSDWLAALSLNWTRGNSMRQTRYCVVLSQKPLDSINCNLPQNRSYVISKGIKSRALSHFTKLSQAWRPCASGLSPDLLSRASQLHIIFKSSPDHLASRNWHSTNRTT